MVTATADIPLGDGERRHDPLCRGGESFCDCPLITAVRQQEQALAQQRVNLTIAAWSEQVKATKTAVRRVALRDAIAAIKSVPCPECSVDAAIAAITDLQP